ncbi:MAG: hypothetical protein RIQ93_1813 [Verrucomicrobiota bacterium]|jgi:uncharacterized protein
MFPGLIASQRRREAFLFTSSCPRQRFGQLRGLVAQCFHPGARRFWLAVLIALAAFSLARAAEVIPPAPPNHFNDYARVTRPETARRLNAELQQFERDTSNQIVVAIYPRLQSNSSVEDYAVRVAQQWRIGQKERKNGAVLFLFQESRDVRIVTGYGLEGALPDALCKQIIENEMIPRFRAGDFDAGLTAGVHAIMAAARGEYRGAGRTAADRAGTAESKGVGFWTFVVIMLVMFGMSRLQRNTLYSRRGRRSLWMGQSPRGGWGGGSSGGGGSFSGGGGSFGGGGAGGKW